MHYIRIWSSRTGNVLHSSRESAFACLLFNKVEEVQHSIVIPSDSHSGINYPPFANANGFETTDCLECLQILDILIYAGGRGNNVLLPRDTSLLSKKFIEFP